MAFSAAAQLSVGPGGLANQTFTTLPPTTEWSTRSVAPSVTSVQTPAQIDAVMQTNTAASINTVLVTTNTEPPAANALAVWNSTGGYVQTRPIGNTLTLLMATLRNTSGLTIAALDVSYDFTRAVIAATAEELPGHYLYYSFTGATGSWRRATGPEGTANGRRSFQLDLVNWANNSLLYVVWADDNGVPNPDDANRIDNVAAAIITAPVITIQPQNQNVSTFSPATFRVSAVGEQPLRYQWYKGVALINNATNSTYTIASATAADNGIYHVTVSNSFGGVMSSNATLSVSCGSTVAISGQPTNVTMNAGQTLTLRVTTTGTTPITYQWYRNGSPLSGATNATFTKANAQSTDSGFYYAVASNCGGSVASTNALVSIAPASFTLVGLTTQTWRYNQTGTDLGTAWRQPGYTNDSTWPTGRGIFALEDDHSVALINTPLLLTNAAGARVLTYYFRTTFVLTNDVEAVTLVSSNIFDDGMIAYLNGTEIYRMNMGSGSVGYTTLAPGTTGEGVYWLTNLPLSVLIKGTNTLAVEVHQVNNTSSDVLFGMHVNVTYPFPTPLEITEQPVSTTVEETKTATFSVGIDGAPAYFQWYRDGVAVTNGTTNPLRVAVATTNNAGSYYVVVTNTLNSVTSSVATLTVIADTNPPVLVDADGSLGNTNVMVSYSELVNPSFATNTANYKITNTVNGTTLTISRAVLVDGTNVLLTTAARAAGTNYILVVNNVRDVSLAQNVIAPNSRMPISTLFRNVVPYAAPYNFYQPQYAFFDPEPNQGTAWKEYDFVIPAYWASGNGGFLYTASGLYEVPYPVGRFLGQSELITSYYRTAFQTQVSPGGARLLLRHFVDDGAVFYLNGTEVARFNMISGPIDYQSRPIATVGTGTTSDQIALPEGAFRFGQNILAAELHQSVPVDLDAAFAMQLDINARSLITGPVVITGGPQDQTVMEGQPVTFMVMQAGGATFQWRRNGANMPGETNYLLRIPAVPLSYNSNLFSVVVGNTNGTATSTNATLRVLVDTAGPLIVGALMTNNTITVSFSEPIAAQTANVTANYRVTNAVGQVQAISSAVLQNNTNVLLSFGALPVTRYTVVVNNIRDASSGNNLIASNSAVVVGYSAEVVAMGGIWKYDDTGTDLGTTWRAVSYSDLEWDSGPALLGAKRGTVPANMPEPLRTTIAMSNNTAQFPAVYFRAAFNAFRSTNAELTFSAIVDDGAVIYLNGVEVQRLGMPEGGAINYTTLAARTVGDTPLLEGPFTVQVNNLVDGVNVIAVEAHQVNLTSSDLYWAGEFAISIKPVVIPPPTNVVCAPISYTAPTLNYERLTTNTVRLSWQNPITNAAPCNLRATYTLEAAQSLTNPSTATVWVPIGTNSPNTITTTNTSRFFRLRRL